ncbi:hypothetical protein DRO54_10325 [Candidatus Bathyarchaeota archaeon]|nr:MAG: hypothetical protein DRO54_10325 [Candidatus Bathyarchaeota archaeon]
MLKNRNLAVNWIRVGIKSIKPEDFVNAMKGGFSPARLIFNHFHTYIQNPVLRPIIQTIFKAYWNEIEYYLTDVRRVYNLLWENPNLRHILSTPEAKRYLNYAVASAYVAIYEFTWLNKNPFSYDS